MYAANSWDDLWDNGKTQVSPLIDTSVAVLVSKTERERDSYGDYNEGDGEIYMVFQVGDRFFRKEGYQSSYGDDRSWDGAVVEVFPREFTSVVYEVKR